MHNKYEELAAKYPAAGKGGKSDKGAWKCKKPECKFDSYFLEKTECHNGGQAKSGHSGASMEVDGGGGHDGATIEAETTIEEKISDLEGMIKNFKAVKDSPAARPRSRRWRPSSGS